MNSKLRLNITLELEDSTIANVIRAALSPETRIKLRGIKVKIEGADKYVHVSIEAPDYSSLRAATNSIIRLTQMIINVLNTIRGLRAT